MLPTTTAMVTTTTLDAQSLCQGDCDVGCNDENHYSDRFQCLLDCYITCIPTTISPTTIDPTVLCQSQGSNQMVT